jgi:hypothetical protein
MRKAVFLSIVALLFVESIYSQTLCNYDVQNGNVVQNDGSIIITGKSKQWGENLSFGVIRVIGYTQQDVGAAYKGEDSVIFRITKESKVVRYFLTDINYSYADIYSKQFDVKNDDIMINLSIPNEYDPEHILLKSSINNQYIIVFQVIPIFERGGWKNTNRILSFQKESELNKRIVERFSENDYSHFYDGM